MQMSTQSKVYISNLNYHTTEDELREFLADTKASNIFIPNYFVGFGSLRFKPLGLAYADFSSGEEAEAFIKDFDGRQFKERKLKVKLHVPYTPGQRLSRRSSVSSIKRISSSRHNTGDEAENHGENKESLSGSKPRVSAERKYSPNAVFVKGLKGKTCEEELKTLFNDFNPVEIKLLRPKGWIRGLKNRTQNALITLDLADGKTIDEVVSALSGEKCCGNPLVVLRAYLNAERDSVTQEEPIETVSQEEKIEVDPEVQTLGPGEVAFVAAGEVSIVPENDHDSREAKVKSIDKENVSHKAVLDVKVGPEAPAIGAVGAVGAVGA